MSDRIAVVNDGRLEQLADPGTLYERPATRWVADFIGESNILPVRLSCEDGAWLGQLEGGRGLALPDPGPAAAAGRCGLVVRPEKVRFDDGRSRLDRAAPHRMRAAYQTRPESSWRFSLYRRFSRSNHGRFLLAIAHQCAISWA